MKGLARVPFLYSQIICPESPLKNNSYLILNYSTSLNCKFSRCMHSLMSRSYANEIRSRNYNYNRFSVVRHPYLLELALYCYCPGLFWG